MDVEGQNENYDIQLKTLKKKQKKTKQKKR